MQAPQRKLLYIAIFFFIFAVLFTAWLLIGNKALTVRNFEISSSKIPSSFDGFKIAQVSDLHNESFSKDNSRLLEKLQKQSPDIIALTGDIIDSWKTDVAVAESFVKEVVKIAPVYYVTGNHEPRIDESEELFALMKNCGVALLRGEKITLEKDGEGITLYGIDDPSHFADYLFGDEAFAVSESLKKLNKGEDFSVLLSHRPEFFELYAENGFDLVLTGHAHGGQFRLPFIGGLFAPGQGLFPKYDSGLYEKNSTSMIVSRGLGNSVFPLRFNNFPEIIMITLKETV